MKSRRFRVEGAVQKGGVSGRQRPDLLRSFLQLAEQGRQDESAGVVVREVAFVGVSARQSGRAARYPSNRSSGTGWLRFNSGDSCGRRTNSLDAADAAGADARCLHADSKERTYNPAVLLPHHGPAQLVGVSRSWARRRSPSPQQPAHLPRNGVRVREWHQYAALVLQ